MKAHSSVVALLALTGVFAACDGSGSGPSNTGRQATFQLATRPKTAAPAAGLQASIGASETVTLGNDVLVIDSVKLVLRQIEFKRVESSGCDPTLPHDGCEELKAGPVLLDLPLGAGAERTFTVAMATGTFDKVEFEIHRPEAGVDDAFITANPSFSGVSIRVWGTFNGAGFSYQSDLDVGQEADLVPPVTVTDNSGAQVTLLVDLSTWFVSNGALVDPNSANPGGQNEGVVKSNIESSFHAFEDANEDGMDDHGGA
jgi:hypothetical protein